MTSLEAMQQCAEFYSTATNWPKNPKDRANQAVMWLGSANRTAWEQVESVAKRVQQIRHEKGWVTCYLNGHQVGGPHKSNVHFNSLCMDVLFRILQSENERS